jgi:hypothetical protein
MLKDTDGKPYKFQPPTTINKKRVDYLEGSITTWEKNWITMIPLDENDTSIWEFCLDDGKIIKTK